MQRPQAGRSETCPYETTAANVPSRLASGTVERAAALLRGARCEVALAKRFDLVSLRVLTCSRDYRFARSVAVGYTSLRQ